MADLHRFKLPFDIMIFVLSIFEWPFYTSLRYHLSLRSLFCLFLSGRFTQVLLYYLMCNFRERLERAL